MFKSCISVPFRSMTKKCIFIILAALSSPVILSTIAMGSSKILVPLKQPGLVFSYFNSAALAERIWMKSMKLFSDVLFPDELSIPIFH